MDGFNYGKQIDFLIDRVLTWKKEENRWNKIIVRAEYIQNIYFVHYTVKFDYRKGGYHGFIQS